MARAYRFGGRVSPGGARVLAGLIGKKARGRNGKPGTGKKLIRLTGGKKLVSPGQRRSLLGLTGRKSW